MRTALFVCFLMICSLVSASDAFPSFNLQTVQTFKGNVVSVQKFNLITRPVSYIQFLLNSDGVEYTVEVGPEWFINEQGLILIPREEIEVKGSLVFVNKKKIILAAVIKKANLELKLRQKDGTPIWTFGTNDP